jgi:hypothetical protein
MRSLWAVAQAVVAAALISQAWVALVAAVAVVAK